MLAAAKPQFEGPSVLAESPDFASTRYADPWDYANIDDVLIDRGPVINATGTAVVNGRLRFQASGPAHVSLIFPGFDGSLPLGREGMRQPLVAADYDHASIRLHSTKRGPGGLFWQDCGVAAPCRQGNLSFVIEPGWHTYVFTLAGQKNWTGNITGLRLAVSHGNPTTYEVDWLRVYRATTPDVMVSGDGPIYWDGDADSANNTASNPNWGPLPQRDGRSVFPAAAYPPGVYRFTSSQGSSAPFEIRAVPRIVFDAPSEAGGEDYATRHLGDPWDMDKAADVAAVGNVQQVSFSGGVLQATNGPPEQNDPYVQLRHDGPLDAERYHRLEVRADYDGPFGLIDAPGGGTHGRLIWSRAETPTVWEDSKEFVTYTTVKRYLIDLRTTPRADIAEDENGTRIGWTGRITRVRWDPNEDRGARRWRLDGVWLRADHESHGAFDVSWTDTAATAGAKVSLYADTNASGYDGVLLATGITQRAGRNILRWSGRSLAAGTYWLYAVADDGVVQGRAYASGPLRVSPSAPPDLRIAGTDRIDTAVKLSKEAFPQGASAVVVARDRDFPDALAAVPLAAAAQGPLLLNPTESLHAGVKAEIQRLGATTVYLMGGTVAQSMQVEHALKSLGVSVRRMAGSSRYATAATAAREAVRLWGGTADSAPLIASGTSFADALAAGPLAAARRQPLLLSYPDAMPSETKQAVADFGARSVTAMGGEKALPSSTVNQVGTVTIERIGGPSRFDTAVLAATAALASGAQAHSLMAASGESFADALAAGPAVAARGGVLVLVAKNLLPEVTFRFVHGLPSSAAWVRVAGGKAAVADHVVGGLADASGH